MGDDCPRWAINCRRGMLRHRPQRKPLLRGDFLSFPDHTRIRGMPPPLSGNRLTLLSASRDGAEISPAVFPPNPPNPTSGACRCLADHAMTAGRTSGLSQNPHIWRHAAPARVAENAAFSEPRIWRHAIADRRRRPGGDRWRHPSSSALPAAHICSLLRPWAAGRVRG
jgi:hypothetical protein